MDKKESVTLYFKEGSSDKIYQASLDPKSKGWVVNFAYGRRGTTLTAGTKTASPVAFASAKKIYDKLVAEKMAKGYTPGADGTPYHGTAQEERATGIFPQLLNSITEDEAAKLLEDPDWVAQEKFDGRRIMVYKTCDSKTNTKKVTGINRKGLEVALPEPIYEAAMALSGWQILMDGELVGDKYFIFDLLQWNDDDLRSTPYSHRMDVLATITKPDMPESQSLLRRVSTPRGTVIKSALMVILKREGREGIVFKRWASRYQPGRPASGGDHLKCKFTATLTAIVAKRNAGKRSVALELMMYIAGLPVEGGKRIPIGNVTIPPNHDIPKADDLVEIRYLYAYRGGSLYQPIYLGVRDDVYPIACNTGQLKYKASDDEEEEA